MTLATLPVTRPRARTTAKAAPAWERRVLRAATDYRRALLLYERLDTGAYRPAFSVAETAMYGRLNDLEAAVMSRRDR
jgi:hypothetical protein